MLPLHDNVPTRRFPVVCVALIVINVLIFLADQATATTYFVYGRSPYGLLRIPQTIGGLSLRYSMIPAQITGAAYAQSYIQPIWLTIFTSMFLHANWVHIGGNMLYLWIFGNNVEDALGRWRFLLFYFVCGVCAAGLQIAANPTSTVMTVGASGAIAGVMGSYIWLYPNARVLTLVTIFFVRISAIIVIGYWFLIQFCNAYFLSSGGMLQHGGGVAYMTHVGGFVAGLLLIVLLGGRKLAVYPNWED